MTNRKSVNVVAGLVTTGALLSLYFFLNPHPADIDARPHQHAGEMLAREAMKLLDPGVRLIVIARDIRAFDVPAAEAQLNSFLEALGKSGIRPAAIRSLSLDPLRVAGVPPGDFFDLLRQSKENDVIVSFLGPPVLAADQLAKLGTKRPRILAVCSGTMPARLDLKRIFEQKLLVAAIVSRPDAPAQARSGSAQNAFEEMFKVITSANVSELPGSAVALNQ